MSENPEVIYLFGAGRRRHIAGTVESLTGTGYRASHCGGWFAPFALKHAQFVRWYSREVADRRMAKLNELPICGHCEKADAGERTR